MLSTDRHTLLVIFPGDDCWIGGDKGEIPAKVLEVNIGPMRKVMFRVVWWDGNARKVEWLEDLEVKPISPNGPFMPIGFHSISDI